MLERKVYRFASDKMRGSGFALALAFALRAAKIHRSVYGLFK
jgi:hypothetical protein